MVNFRDEPEDAGTPGIQIVNHDAAVRRHVSDGASGPVVGPTRTIAIVATELETAKSEALRTTEEATRITAAAAEWCTKARALRLELEELLGRRPRARKAAAK